MKTNFILLFLLLAACSTPEKPSTAPSNWGQRKQVAFADLQKGFSDPDMIYAPFIFWFWDEPLKPEKMAEMAWVMGSQGFNPGYAHARHSMVGTPSLPDSEWLGNRWFQSFGAALGESEKQNKYLGYCDEYWWPSFQANGRVLKQNPELRAESLKWQVTDAMPGTEIKGPASYFTVAARLAKPVEPTPPLPELGKWIWVPGVKETPHSCWFRYEFDLPPGCTIAAASIRMTADNSFTLYVNGEKASEGNNWEKPVMSDIAKLLTAGKNLLAVECKNLDGPSGLIAGISVTLGDGRTLKFNTSGSWLASLSVKPGWEKPGHSTAGWQPVREIAGAGENPWSVVGNTEPFMEAVIIGKTLKVIGAGEPFTWKVPEGSMWRVYVFENSTTPVLPTGSSATASILAWRPHSSGPHWNPIRNNSRISWVNRFRAISSITKVIMDGSSPGRGRSTAPGKHAMGVISAQLCR